jgi:hypothetical protein
MFDRQLQVAEQMGDHVGQTNALGSLGEYGVQGILTEGRISTIDLLVLTSSYNAETYLSFLRNMLSYKEVNFSQPSPSVRIPCSLTQVTQHWPLTFCFKHNKSHFIVVFLLSNNKTLTIF